MDRPIRSAVLRSDSHDRYQGTPGDSEGVQDHRSERRETEAGAIARRRRCEVRKEIAVRSSDERKDRAGVARSRAVAADVPLRDRRVGGTTVRRCRIGV